MQIHELNTFTGIPGNTDFLAIDAGFDTAKISAEKLLEPKLDKPEESGEAGQLLSSTGDGGTEWTNVGQPTDEQTAQAVSDWLDAHPEATTTVADGSLTKAKFSSALQLEAIKDYVIPEMFGAAGDGTTDDTSAFVSALADGRPVICFNKYKINSDITIPKNSNLIIEGTLYLYGKLIISGEDITISGDGIINSYGSIAILFVSQGENVRDVAITVKEFASQTSSDTCIAITNAAGSKPIVYLTIDTTIKGYDYAIHSYDTAGTSWFTCIQVLGLIENCKQAVAFEWGGTGSFIGATIQPVVGSTHTWDEPLIIVRGSCIIQGMIWDMLTANNKYAIELIGRYNRVLSTVEPNYIKVSPIEYYYNTIMPQRSWLQADKRLGNYFTEKLRTSALNNEMSVMPYFNFNNLAYMAGSLASSKVLTVSPSAYQSGVRQICCETTAQYGFNSNTTLVIELSFPVNVALREMAVCGQTMPDSVKFEYLGTDDAYHELVTRNINVDYASSYGANNTAFWQFTYNNPANFTALFAKGVRITCTGSTSFILNKIHVGSPTNLYVDKFGDDSVRTNNLVVVRSNGDAYQINVDSSGNLSATLI